MSKNIKGIESKKESKEGNKNILNKNSERNNRYNKQDNKIEENLDNIIIGYIKIKENNLTIRIINSYENEDKNKKDYDKSKENEEEIKDCEIFINEKK